MSKKIYITETQFKSLTENKKKAYKKNSTMDYIKADRKGRRESDKEIYGDGFKSTTKIHKSSKNYSRKGKNKFNNNYSDLDD